MLAFFNVRYLPASIQSDVYQCRLAPISVPFTPSFLPERRTDIADVFQSVF